MTVITTFPDLEVTRGLAEHVPPYMHPNTKPFAVMGEGILTPEECDLLLYVMMTVEPYSFQHCGATTRECPQHETLDPIRMFALLMNDAYFGYDLTPDTNAWLQSYESGDEYLLHMDASPGQTRKLTAVALLSDGDSYFGGDLELFFEPSSRVVPRARGTIAVFPSWMLHRVHPVTSGLRQTINLGFWGPSFR